VELSAAAPSDLDEGPDRRTPPLASTGLAATRRGPQIPAPSRLYPILGIDRGLAGAEAVCVR